MAEAKTHTLDVPGAVLCYDVRTAETDSDAPVLLLIASPMDARGFTTLAGYFTDRTVVGSWGSESQRSSDDGKGRRKR